MTETERDRRFVLLRHELPPSSVRASHYDLMLERADDLFTLELGEALAPGVPQSARELAPHRKAYLDYEGPISRDRGEVQAVDRGSMTIAIWNDATVDVELCGAALRGRLTLVLEASQGGAPACWRVDFKAS